MTEVRSYRTAHRDEWRESFDTMPSLNDVVLKAAATALTAHPALNTALIEGTIHRYREINLGVAIDVEDGLVVPVLRNADQLDLGQIASGVARLSTRAKEAKLTPGRSPEPCTNATCCHPGAVPDCREPGCRCRNTGGRGPDRTRSIPTRAHPPASTYRPPNW